MPFNVKTLLQALMFVILARFPSVAGLADLPPADQSEYASLGKIKQYVGHVNDVIGLKAALEACSYRNETIFISTTEHFVDAAAQTMDMLR